MENQTEIAIVLAFTPNYFVPACTTIQSVLSNSNKSQTFNVYCLLTQDLSIEQVDMLNNWDPDRLRFTFINLDGKLEGIYVDERYTIAASYRLLLPDILPTVNKIIYIDCDFVVQNDLAVLYNDLDLSSYYLAAVYESPLDFQEDYVVQLGCIHGQYFNSGFLMMNLELLRKEGIVQKFMEASRVPYLQFPDQDVLNIVCKNHVYALKPYWNSIRTFFISSYKNEFMEIYTIEDWNDVHHRGNIHYTGTKPWEKYTIRFGEWWKYYFKLPYTIRKQWELSRKLCLIGWVSSTWLGSLAINGVHRMYRELKRK
ncbi:glycosyltransferase family 8 protein [Sphingobacterium rhinopitheci]|uniref:glycosyltransferase family 8 protein n=1 Tax=Sphingobacterium rhinopitheci TaxID=2781960 RepID=UPI001F527A8A|nr:glycosyltransferase family 8 protein [Sphingobacterium rhinopitheci]MCI0920758.1 glycosyltransferase family 8 protein [Sphingobacterium rhinopitheci]